MIRLKILKGQFQKDADTFSKMDPFLKLQLGQKKFQTKAHRGGGVNPQWNQDFQLNVQNQQQLLLKIQAWDQDPLKNDILGRVEVNLKKWMENTNNLKFQVIDLEDKGEKTGSIRIQYMYLSNVSAQEKGSGFLLN